MFKRMIWSLLFLFTVSFTVNQLHAVNVVPKRVYMEEELKIEVIAEVIHFRNLPYMGKGVVEYLKHSRKVGLQNIYKIKEADKKLKKFLNIRVLYYEPKVMIKFQIFQNESGEGKKVELKLDDKEARKLRKTTKKELEINKEMAKVLAREYNMDRSQIKQFFIQVKLISFGLDKYVTQYW